MPTMIADFARVITDSNVHAALSLDEEIARIEALCARGLCNSSSGWETFRGRTAREAREATSRVVAEAQELAQLWSSAIQSLRQGLTLDEQISILESFLNLSSSLEGFQKSVTRVWELVEQMGTGSDGAAALDEASRLFEQVRSEATRALMMRNAPWQPSDPARLRQGILEVEEGKGLSPEETRAFFRKA